MFSASNQYPLLEVLAAGGPVMVPLAICSVTALAIIIERLVWGPRRSRVMPPALIEESKALLREHRLDELSGVCRASGSPLGRIIGAALDNSDRPRTEVLEAVEMAGRREALKMQRYLGTLGTIAAASPLLGLLGTVLGMIKTFEAVRAEGVGNPQALSGGIAEALIATAAGLTIAVPALVLHKYFVGHTRHLVVEMESKAAEVLTQLYRSQSLRGVKENEPPAEVARGAVKRS